MRFVVLIVEGAIRRTCMGPVFSKLTEFPATSRISPSSSGTEATSVWLAMMRARIFVRYTGSSAEMHSTSGASRHHHGVESQACPMRSKANQCESLYWYGRVPLRRYAQARQGSRLRRRRGYARAAYPARRRKAPEPRQRTTATSCRNMHDVRNWLGSLARASSIRDLVYCPKETSSREGTGMPIAPVP